MDGLCNPTAVELKIYIKRLISFNSVIWLQGFLPPELQSLHTDWADVNRSVIWKRGGIKQKWRRRWNNTKIATLKGDFLRLQESSFLSV